MFLLYFHINYRFSELRNTSCSTYSYITFNSNKRWSTYTILNPVCNFFKNFSHWQIIIFDVKWDVARVSFSFPDHKGVRTTRWWSVAGMSQSFDRVSVESRAKRFHESISIVISGTGGVKSGKERNPNSTSTRTSSSSSSSFSFTVECPRLAFRARYTFRTRKPRRVRLQTEFACKTRSLACWRSFIVRGTILTSFSFQYRALWNCVIVANSALEIVNVFECVPSIVRWQGIKFYNIVLS